MNTTILVRINDITVSFIGNDFDDTADKFGISVREEHIEGLKELDLRNLKAVIDECIQHAKKRDW